MRKSGAPISRTHHFLPAISLLLGMERGWALSCESHARSIDASAIDIATGETWSETFGGCPSAAEIAERLATLPQPLYSACRREGRADS